MRNTSTLTAIRRLAPVLLGGRGSLWFGLATGGWLAQGVVEWGMAALLLVFLHSLELVDRAALPVWIPARLLDLGALAIWATILGVAVLQSALQLVSYQSRILLSERAHARLRMLLAYRTIVREARPPALSRMTYLSSEIFPRTVGFLFHLTQIACYALHALALTTAMFVVAPGTAAVAFAGILVSSLLVLRFNHLNNRAAARVPKHQAEYERAKVRLARNWLLIRALRLERLEYASQLEASARSYRATVVAYFFSHLGNALGPLVAAILLAAVVVVHVLWLRNPPAELLAFIYLLFRFQQMLANGSHILGGLFTYGPHVVEADRFVAELSHAERARALAADAAFGVFGDRSRLRTLLDTDPAFGGDGIPAPAAPSIRSRQLEFRWPDEPLPVFSELDLDLEGGAQLGIVGANGAGKSTFLAVLLGTLAPTRGTVELAGIEGTTWISRHRMAVGFVGAEAYLIQGSVRENLLYGLSGRTGDEEIAAVLARVGLARLVGSFADGLDHRIEEGGEGLSAGEKQKLSIARALLRHPRLLVLDEPTAHVDAESEEEIVETLQRLRGECTVVLVSHKTSVLRHADRHLRFGPKPARASRSDTRRALEA